MTIVAIDGPGGSGKSTVAQALSLRLGVPHVDTGAYYRAAALAVLRSGVDVRDEVACSREVGQARITRAGGRTFLNGTDVEDQIRSSEVTAVVSAVSGHPALRQALLELQRAAVGPDGAVVEGRDAGTVIVPWADLKVWLTASPEERARRRAQQLGESDPKAADAHARDLARRDLADAARMVKAPDAIEIDTTGWQIEDLVSTLAGLAKEAVRGDA